MLSRALRRGEPFTPADCRPVLGCAGPCLLAVDHCRLCDFHGWVPPLHVAVHCPGFTDAQVTFPEPSSTGFELIHLYGCGQGPPLCGLSANPDTLRGFSCPSGCAREKTYKGHAAHCNLIRLNFRTRSNEDCRGIAGLFGMVALNP